MPETIDYAIVDIGSLCSHTVCDFDLVGRRNLCGVACEDGWEVARERVVLGFH